VNRSADSHAESGADPRLAGCRLTIDLAALVANFIAMARLSGRAEAAAVVKADAYGLGIGPVAEALAGAGCRRFFVTWPEEGMALRRIAGDRPVYVLGGVADRHAAEALAGARLIPVLNGPEEAAIWSEFGRRKGSAPPAAIHVDTGMNRLGFSIAEALALAENPAERPVLLVSHLACADNAGHPRNGQQLESFQRLRRAFQGVESSLANSAGILLGSGYHFDLTRPGIALYGGMPAAGFPSRPVVTCEGRICQIRHARAGETVSYGATVTLTRDTTIAVAAVGYGDGLHRALSGSGVPLRKTGIAGGHGHVAGRRVPILGRVTMDVTMFDVTDLPQGTVRRGDWIEIFGPNIGLDEAASSGGTVSYELLTDLGRRFHRRYIGRGGAG
jgi:alanine racemase